MRLAMSGYYGFRNTGDEAVLAGTIRGFERKGLADARSLTVLSADPQWTASVHGVHAVPRMDFGAVRGALREADLLLSGGGSLLQDVTSLRSLLYYVGVVLMARRLGTPHMLYAQGIGPLRRAMSRALVRRVAATAAAITVRDTASAELLRLLGIPSDRIFTTADPALLLDGPGSSTGARSDTPVVGLAIRPWQSLDVVRIFGEAAQQITRKGVPVVWIAMQTGYDDVLCRDAASVYGGTFFDAQGLPTEALEIMASVDVLVGMRLHALMLAALCDAVPVGLAYDPKVDAFMQRLGLVQLTLPITAVTGQAIASLALQALEDRPPVEEAMRSAMPSLRDEALRNVEIAAAAVT